MDDYFRLNHEGEWFIRLHAESQKYVNEHVACNSCFAVLDNATLNSFDPDMQWEDHPFVFFPLMFWRNPFLLLSNALAQPLEPHLGNALLGPAVLDGATSTEYELALVGRDLWIPAHAEDTTKLSHCKECNRQLRSVPGDSIWIDRHELAERQLVSISGGRDIVLSSELYHGVCDSIGQRLSVVPVRVK